MIVYLAGCHFRIGMVAEVTFGGDGSLFLSQGSKETMKLFLAGTGVHHLALDQYKELYLKTGNEGSKYYDRSLKDWKPYLLESFFYADADTERLIPYMGDFLLDSGAFSFISGAKSVDWDDYIKRYANFINRNKVEKYFELDIDSVVGYEKVLDFRKKLEDLTGKPSIPVWHISRGKDEFLKSCEEYSYVALGGIVSGEWWTEEYFPWFINEAHKRGVKIHGLGYTKIPNLKRFHFDSVDSTAWTTGNRFGYFYKFNGHTMTKIDAPQGMRIKAYKEAALVNYTEWLKFQKYAKDNL